ncbi:MAG TPA: hypothetical protein VHW71_04240 [Steroidobacteraceae bacterium]|nr:hypothetical protein [Steroidobacteraceae bacterium]
MDEKVSKWPMIGLIAGSATALLAFSVWQSSERKAKQESEYRQLQERDQETAAAMQQIGAAAARAAKPDPTYDELQREIAAQAAMDQLDREDAAEFARKHPGERDPSASAKQSTAR